MPLIDYTEYDPVDTKGYPPNLSDLLGGEAVRAACDDDEDKIRFLRRKPDRPDDPGSTRPKATRQLGMGRALLPGRADATSWCRKNVYDVFTKSHGRALDGSKYRDW